MVNHLYLDTLDATACGEYKGSLAESISVDHIDSVSCNECRDAVCTCGHEGLERHWHLSPCPIKAPTQPDPVNSPEHYRWLPVEVIEITEHLSFTLGNVVKYVLRADHKGKPLEDLEKAAWYLDREIQRRKRGD